MTANECYFDDSGWMAIQQQCLGSDLVNMAGWQFDDGGLYNNNLMKMVERSIYDGSQAMV